MAGIHRNFCGDVFRKSVSTDPLRADHASGGVLCAAGAAPVAASGAGGFVWHRVGSSALVRHWAVGQ